MAAHNHDVCVRKALVEGEVDSRVEMWIPDLDIPNAREIFLSLQACVQSPVRCIPYRIAGTMENAKNIMINNT